MTPPNREREEHRQGPPVLDKVRFHENKRQTSVNEARLPVCTANSFKAKASYNTNRFCVTINFIYLFVLFICFLLLPFMSLCRVSRGDFLWKTQHKPCKTTHFIKKKRKKERKGTTSGFQKKKKKKARTSYRLIIL